MSPLPRYDPLKVPRTAVAPLLGRTLMLAPHPDDETIGCGGLLALLTQAAMPVHVVLVSDGAASHPGSKSHLPARMRVLRLQEMVAALRELGCGANQLSVLALPDGAIPLPDGPGYAEAFERLSAIALAFCPDTILLPWRHDNHPDHRASHALGAAVCDSVMPWVRRLEYPVWPPDASGTVHDEDGVSSRRWDFDVTPVLAQKHRALAQHRSQRGQVVFDDPEGFTLPPALIAVCAHPVETYYCFKQGDGHEFTANVAAGLFR